MEQFEFVVDKLGIFIRFILNIAAFFVKLGNITK